MKKLMFLTLGLLVVIVGFFAFSVFYSKSKVDLFFTADNKSLYNAGGVVWKLNDFESKIFNGKYTTEFSILDEKIADFEHEAKFGLSGLNIFNIGSIETTVNFYDQVFNVSSDVKFGGINTKIDVKANSKEFNNTKEEFFTFSWKDIKANYFTSFERDIASSNADIPYFLANINTNKDNVSFEIENQKYSSHMSKRKVGLWLGDSSIKIGKISVAVEERVSYYTDNYNYDDYYAEDGYDDYDDYAEDYDYGAKDDEYAEEEIEVFNTNVTFSDIDMLFSIKEGDNLTITSDNRLSLKNFILNNDEVNLTLNDIVSDVSFQNIDLNSLKKIEDSLKNVNFQDQKQLMYLGMSFMGYAPDILAKHPKIALNEFSIKYADQIHKVSGFIQYIGNGDLKSLQKNIQNDLIAKFDISIGQTFVKEILSKDFNSYYYDPEEIEELVNKRIKGYEKMGFEIGNNEIKGTIEYKNGDLLINGKSSPLLGVLDSIF
ncbi:MAG: YdgA family protein [Campylobacteraceae bacterium]|jgi:uncharacterized protein YdgA (DUF945 family)|nr:YdgA family protein [Campylobacteraceae bacterium]